MFGEDNELFVAVLWILQNLVELLKLGFFSQAVNAARYVEEPLHLHSFCLQLLKRTHYHPTEEAIFHGFVFLDALYTALCIGGLFVKHIADIVELTLKSKELF